MISDIVRSVIVSLITFIIIIAITYYFGANVKENSLDIPISGGVNDERTLNIEMIRRVYLRKLTSNMLSRPGLKKVVNTHLRTVYGTNLDLKNMIFNKDYESELSEIQIDPEKNKQFFKLLEDRMIQEELEFEKTIKRDYEKVSQLFDPTFDNTLLNHYLINHLGEVRADVDKYRAPMVDLT